jgi:hypothetical protein
MSNRPVLREPELVTLVALALHSETALTEA